MKYQALKKLKTKTKLIKMCDTLKEAHEVITSEGAKFHSFGYIGGFPIYEREKESGKYYYNIQGAMMLDVGGHIVCSIDEKELKAFDFHQ